MTFRQWCYHMWQQHKDEIEAWTGHSPCYQASHYFNQYRWWLRQQYRQQGVDCGS